MITNYIPNTCGYGLNNLKKVVHIFSESTNVVHIDNGEAYVTSGITNFQTIKAASVSFEESVSYDDRFKFQKTVTATVNGLWKLSELGGKYYVVLEDENGVMWLVNADFPSLVTYTYTLQDGTDETVFTFSALSNFPTLKLNANINNAYECKNYTISRVDELKMLEKRYANLNASSGIVYGYSNQVYKTVKFNEGSFKLEESFDGVDASTTIQFDIDFDAYQSSWHYNILEYPYNKYVAVIGHLACGFEMGLVPSYNVQGSHQIGGGDTVTVTLVGGSQRGSEWAESWMEVTVAPQYTWRLTKEFECQQTRWVDVEYVCSGITGYDKYLIQKEQMWDYETDDWVDTDPLVTRETLVEERSQDCGYVSFKYIYSRQGTSQNITGRCNSSSAITRSDTSEIYSIITNFIIGDCVTAIGDNTFSACFSLTNIDIPNNITTIGSAAFDTCTGFTNIIIPDSVTSIGNNAFQGCSGLTSVTMSNSITEIGEYMFWDCRKLSSFQIPSGVTSIGDYAFNHCTRLTGITIPNSTASIGSAAFKYCSGLTSVDIGSGLTYLGNTAFAECGNLSSVTILATTPPTIDHMTSIVNNPFYNTSPNLKIYVPSESVNLYKAAYGWSDYADRIFAIP